MSAAGHCRCGPAAERWTSAWRCGPAAGCWGLLRAACSPVRGFPWILVSCWSAGGPAAPHFCSWAGRSAGQRSSSLDHRTETVLLSAQVRSPHLDTRDPVSGRHSHGSHQTSHLDPAPWRHQPHCSHLRAALQVLALLASCPPPPCRRPRISAASISASG